MIINPSLPSGYTIFCDDIRFELGGKVTYVGIYNNEMIIQADGPVALPKLSIAAVLRIAMESLPADYDIKILQLIDGEELELVSMNVEAPAPPEGFVLEPLPDPDSVRFGEIKAHANLSPFLVPSSMRLSVRAYSGEDHIRLGSLRVTVTKPPAEDASAVPAGS